MFTTCNFVKQILISAKNKHEIKPTRQATNGRTTSPDDIHLM